MKSSETLGFSRREWVRYILLFFFFGLGIVILANFVPKILGYMLIVTLLVMMYISFHILRWLKKKELLGFTKLSKGQIIPKPKMYDKVVISRKNLKLLWIYIPILIIMFWLAIYKRPQVEMIFKVILNSEYYNLIFVLVLIIIVIYSMKDKIKKKFN